MGVPGADDVMLSRWHRLHDALAMRDFASRPALEFEAHVKAGTDDAANRIRPRNVPELFTPCRLDFNLATV